ncbi:hypothetical protein KVR801_50023 [Klebsiella variicola]|nr:hypothetical protein KVR801_50023 [Klebsiella variicola]
MLLADFLVYGTFKSYCGSMIMGLSARFWLTPVIFWCDHPLAVPLLCCERTGHSTT